MNARHLLEGEDAVSGDEVTYLGKSLLSADHPAPRR